MQEAAEHSEKTCLPHPVLWEAAAHADHEFSGDRRGNRFLLLMNPMPEQGKALYRRGIFTESSRRRRENPAKPAGMPRYAPGELLRLGEGADWPGAWGWLRGGGCYCRPRSASCLRLLSSMVSTLWQVAQSLAMDLPEAEVWLPSWQRLQPG